MLTYTQTDEYEEEEDEADNKEYEAEDAYDVKPDIRHPIWNGLKTEEKMDDIMDESRKILFSSPKIQMKKTQNHALEDEEEIVEESGGVGGLGSTNRVPPSMSSFGKCVDISSSQCGEKTSIATKSCVRRRGGDY